MGVPKKVGIFLGIKYEPLSNPPSLKYVSGAPRDFHGKDCAFVANWLRGKGLNKLCAVFEVFKF